MRTSFYKFRPLSPIEPTRPRSFFTMKMVIGCALGGLLVNHTRETYDSYRKEKEHILHDIPFSVFMLKLLPLKLLSLAWGRIHHMELPQPIRTPIYSAFAKMTGADLSEMRESSLASYPHLGAFFIRRLKEDARVVSPDHELVSPSDGLIIGCGAIDISQYQFKEANSIDPSNILENIMIEQVKGFRFPISQFLGEYKEPKETLSGGSKSSLAFDLKIPASKAANAAPLNAQITLHPEPRDEPTISFISPPPTRLYFCTIYLAPGDYHRFHSPTDWSLSTIRQVHGELLPVAPPVISWIQNVYVLNERVPLIGHWKHGRFSMTPVGSTNVGKVKIHGDFDIPPNQPFIRPWTANVSIETAQPVALQKGVEMGYFDMGSTIVLIFEAPEHFNFTVTKGQKIRVGAPLGEFSTAPSLPPPSPPVTMTSNSL